jgi:hypothetical protein
MRRLLATCCGPCFGKRSKPASNNASTLARGAVIGTSHFEFELQNRRASGEMLRTRQTSLVSLKSHTSDGVGTAVETRASAGAPGTESAHAADSEQRRLVKEAWDTHEDAKTGGDTALIASNVSRTIELLSTLTDPISNNNALLLVAAHLSRGRKRARSKATRDVEARIALMAKDRVLWEKLVAQAGSLPDEVPAQAQRRLLLTLSDEVYPEHLTKTQVERLYKPLKARVLPTLRAMLGQQGVIAPENRAIAQVIVERLETSATLSERLILAPEAEIDGREIHQTSDEEYSNDLGDCIERLDEFASPNTLHYVEAFIASQIMRTPGIDTKIFNSGSEVAAFIVDFPSPVRTFSAIWRDDGHASAIVVEIGADKSVGFSLFDPVDSSLYAASNFAGIRQLKKELSNAGFRMSSDSMTMMGMQRDDDSCAKYSQSFTKHFYREGFAGTMHAPPGVLKLAQRRSNTRRFRESDADAWDHLLVNKKGLTIDRATASSRDISERTRTFRTQALADLKALQASPDSGAQAWASLLRRMRPVACGKVKTDAKLGRPNFSHFPDESEDLVMDFTRLPS